MSEIYAIDELHEGECPIKFKIRGSYQRKYPIVTDKLKCAIYKSVYSIKNRNIGIELVSYVSTLSCTE